MIRRNLLYRFLNALLITAVPVVLGAQGSFKPLTDLQIFGSTTNKFLEIQLDIKDIEGSAYLEEEFTEGRVMMYNTMYEGVRLRYNVYNDLFEANQGDNNIVIDPLKNDIDTFYYQGYKFVRKFLPHQDQILSHVGVLFDHRNCTLYKKFRTILIPAEKASAYTEAKPARFNTVQPDYYLGRGEDLFLLKGNKAIADFFQVEQKEVKNLVRSRKLKLQREEDLIRICAHFSGQESGE